MRVLGTRIEARGSQVPTSLARRLSEEEMSRLVQSSGMGERHCEMGRGRCRWWRNKSAGAAVRRDVLYTMRYPLLASPALSG